MKKRIIKIGILVLILVILVIVIIERNLVFKTKNVVFYLEEKYYGESVFNEIKSKEFKSLVDKDESFAIFIHHSFCSTSYEFNKVLAKYAEKNKISFYKMSFEEMKKTSMYKKIKYYPSFAIFKDGKMIDFLDAESDEDLKRYKEEDEFHKWFSKYIKFKSDTQ